ncbi:heterokaryon incompatibility protein 6, OR allele [Cladorrhinum sp. PSN332]|nr:heterokaryon incompatibility protein 6, OR allele [Cladorrhinum sp. PSN332]
MSNNSTLASPQTEPTAHEYKYSPLPSNNARAFRLLYLLSGARGDGIRCHLIDSDLDEEEDKFEALSYVWGDSSAPTPIQVNDATFPVGENLHSALLNLRSVQDTRVLWVDAICINQSDDGEKDTQVGMMGDIYRRSLSAVVWFGNATEHTGKVFAEIRKLGDSKWAEDMRREASLRDSYEDWNCIFANTWWERAWTLQEIILAKSALLVMGLEAVDWQFFCDAIQRASLLGYFPRGIGAVAAPAQTEVLDKLQAIRSLPPGIKTSGDELLYYLACSSGREATQHKLFSVLGLVGGPIQDDANIALKPNYGSEPAGMYTAAARAIITTSGNLDALGFCHPTDMCLPSWGPDWGTTSDLTFASPLLQDAQGKRRASHASKGASCRPQWDDGNKILTLQGHSLDCIADLTEAQPKWYSKVVVTADSKFAFTTRSSTRDVQYALQDFFAHARRYIAWEEFVKANVKDLVPDEAMAVFRETLTTGTHHNSGAGEKEESFRLWLHCNRSMIRELDTTGRYDIHAIYLDTGTFAPYLGHTANRRLGITKGSRPPRLCLLPKHTKVGDLLVILRGGRFPVILRPCGPDNLVEFIGEAYVHGIMDGEAFDNDRCVEFRIR